MSHLNNSVAFNSKAQTSSHKFNDRLMSLSLKQVALELSNYREQFGQVLIEAEKISQFNFDKHNTDPRAVRRNGVARAYFSLVKRLTREPTLSEVTNLYNARYHSTFSKWTIRRTILKMNDQLSTNNLQIVLTKETPSLLYTRDVAFAYQNCLLSGKIPNGHDLYLNLIKTHPKSSVTNSVIKLHLSILRKNGVSVPLRQGELTREITEETFQKLHKKLRTSPSLEQMQIYIKDKYKIETSRDALSKMLEVIRDSKPKGERANWFASRTRKVYDQELIRAYKISSQNLAERGIKRLPAISDIQRYIEEVLNKHSPSHDTLVLRYRSINQSRQEKHQKPLIFIKQAFKHHDLIEEAAFKVSIKLERAPTLKEIRKEANRTAAPRLTLSQVDKAIRTINRNRRDEDKIQFTYQISSNVYNLDVLRIHRKLTETNNKLPTRELLLKAVLAEDKNRNITMSGLDYRIKRLRKLGYEIKFYQSPKTPTKSWAERQAEREKRRSIEREALCNKLIKEEIARKFGDKVPSHIKRQTQFFSLCVEISLKETGNSEVKARRELRDLLRIHREPIKQKIPSESGDDLNL